MEIIIMNTENSKTNESHKFFLSLSQRLDLRSSDKHVALQNVSIYYTWKNIQINMSLFKTYLFITRGKI